MNYVLSTGKTTSNSIEYIKDCIRLEMSLLYKDIPYFYGGIDIIDDSLVTSNVEASIGTIVDSMLKRISSTVPGITLITEGISFGDTSINIEIKINGTSSYYELQRRN